MNQPATLDSLQTSRTLRGDWDAYRRARPAARTHEAAAELGVSEAQLLATGCGDGVTRLSGHWAELVYDVGALGPVQAITRNTCAAHEALAEFRNIRFADNNGLVFDRTFALRLFLDRWQSGFAVCEQTAHGVRHSLQFFDAYGDCLHKVLLSDASDSFAYQSFVGAHRSTDQSREQPVRARPKSVAERPDADIDLRRLRGDWLALGAAHDFGAMLACHGLCRRQALRLGGPNLAWPVHASLFGELIQTVADADLPVHLHVGSSGACQSHSGPIQDVQIAGTDVRVVDTGFRLHLRGDGIAEAWVVRTPTPRGEFRTLELYDAAGGRIASLCGPEATHPKGEAWRRILAAVPNESSRPFT